MNQNHTSESYRDAFKGYVVGFVLSVIITLVSFSVVLYFDVSSLVKITAISLLAATQVAVQTYYFLHIGQQRTPKWNTHAYLFMVMSVALIVLGSLWVMSHLNYNMMHHDTSKDEQYIIKDEGIDPKERKQ